MRIITLLAAVVLVTGASARPNPESRASSTERRTSSPERRAPSAAGPTADSKTYTGVITDSMCAANHDAMNVSPESRCVKDCVGDGKTYKYGLLIGSKLYLLSDQETPAQFAGKKVKVRGVLYQKTNIIKVEAIEAAK